MALKEENWVILELTEKGEDEARQGNLLPIICRNNRFKPTDVFIPIIKTGECSYLLRIVILLITIIPSLELNMF